MSDAPDWQAFSIELAKNAKRNLDAKDDEIDRLKARVSELEDFVADTYTACQRSLDPDWVPDWVQESLAPISERCRSLLGDYPDEYESAWLLCKQAEAVEALKFPVMMRKMWSGTEVDGWLNGHAQRLRKQADDIGTSEDEG